jgi:hypothetical protein
MTELRKSEENVKEDEVYLAYGRPRREARPRLSLEVWTWRMLKDYLDFDNPKRSITFGRACVGLEQTSSVFWIWPTW